MSNYGIFTYFWFKFEVYLLVNHFLIYSPHLMVFARCKFLKQGEENEKCLDKTEGGDVAICFIKTILMKIHRKAINLILRDFNRYL